MKKKTVIAILVVAIVILAAVLMFFSNQAKRKEAASMPAAPQQEQSAVPAETQEPVVIEEDALTTNTSADEIKEKMLPIIDAAVRVMYENGAGFYDMENTSFKWNVLAMLCSSNDLNDPSIKIENGSVTIPKETMGQLAAACFASNAELPELPKELTNVKLDEASGAYTIEQSDKGDIKCEIMEALPLGENGYTVSVALVSESDEEKPLLSTYTFDLLPYTLEEGQTASPLFPMCVMNAYDSCNVLAQIESIEEDGDKIKLLLHHVQFHWQLDEEDGETYLPLIVADTKSDETLPLFSKDAVDWNTIGMVIAGEDQGFKNSDEAFKWFKENYTEKVQDENVIYQMRVYDGVIYSVAPLYAFYFQG